MSSEYKSNKILLPLMERIETEEIQNVNDLPPEVICRIFPYLQDEIVLNRTVCTYWRDVIDDHCPIKVKFLLDDKFVDRKFQLRIRNCKVYWLPKDSSENNFAYPQYIRSITFDKCVSLENVCCLLSQVESNLQILKIQPRHLEDVSYYSYAPFAFPQLRGLKIKQWDRAVQSLTLDIFFPHRMPVLENLTLSFFHSEVKQMDGIYTQLFAFLVIHRHSMKNLDVDIQWKGVRIGQAFKLPKDVKSLLYDGKLQLKQLHLNLQTRYISVWTPIITSQKNLIHLKVSNVSAGIPFNLILPGIELSIATLRTICLEDILSFSQDGTTWVPLDCTAFRNAVNLAKLVLDRSRAKKRASPKPDKNEGAPIVNLREIPLACLKMLEIRSFVCDSGELQTLVDNAPLLEHLTLDRTLAPSNGQHFGSTGPHGGIIKSFTQKPNKRYIFLFSINYSNQEENHKFDEVRCLYQNRYPERQRVTIYSHYFH